MRLWLSVRLPERLARHLPPHMRSLLVKGEPDTAEGQWLRAVMLPDTRAAFEALDPPSLEAVEVTGELERDAVARVLTPRISGIRPLFPPDPLPGPFDLVICEQVLEHVPDPLKAVRTLRRLCRPDGHVYVSTPFLVRLHDWPGDYWRFTPDGLALLLRSQGLEPLWVRSWGNRDVALANFDHWVPHLAGQSLRNEPQLPVSVWALARPVGAGEPGGAGDRG